MPVCRTLTATVFGMLALASCTTAETSEREALQASARRAEATAQHWDVVAADLAERIAAALPGEATRPVFLHPTDSGIAQAAGFRAFLADGLRAQGRILAKDESDDAVEVDYALRVVEYRDRGTAPPLVRLSAPVMVLRTTATDGPPPLGADRALWADILVSEDHIPLSQSHWTYFLDGRDGWAYGPPGHGKNRLAVQQPPSDSHTDTAFVWAEQRCDDDTAVLRDVAGLDAGRQELRFECVRRY